MTTKIITKSKQIQSIELHFEKKKSIKLKNILKKWVLKATKKRPIKKK
jgi:hypothetical protein